jgi:HNH endonuclease/AP2 domain
VKRRSRLTRTRLRELLDYNKETGEFRWRKRDIKGIRPDLSAGTIRSPQGYRYIKIDGRVYSEHQLAWFYMKGRWGKPAIDHRDRDPSNNQWNNLRRATLSQNAANRPRPRNNTSGYKGACLCRESGKWRASIKRNGKMIHLGRFETPQAAHEAYCTAARKLFGKFARAA